MRFLYILIVLVSAFSSSAQLTNSTDDKRVEALNNYVFFANECTHGMLIVHGLLYKFNQDLNREIDLDSYEVNFYSNKDLPADIFADTWFYDIAPYDWHKKAVASSSIFPSEVAVELNNLADELKSKVFDINRLRFDLEKLVAADMTNQNNVLAVYEELEKATKLFYDFHSSQLKLTNQLHKIFNELKPSLDIEYPELISELDDIYNVTYTILNTLYNRSDEDLLEKMDALNVVQSKLEVSNLDSYNGTRLLSRYIQSHYKNLKNQVASFTASTNKFYNKAEIPEEYHMYGKYYYYYNKDLISKFNRFGIGIVFEINSILDYLQSDQLRYMEVPHFYQVVYPKKINEIRYIKASTPVVTTVPKKLNGRKIITADMQIKVDSNKVSFNISDYKLEDGDIVSVNFNGDWVIRDLKIKTIPFEIKLQLNEEGKNFLIIHSEDEGRRPPTTIILSYMYNGEEQKIIMEADKKTSQLIEIL